MIEKWFKIIDYPYIISSKGNVKRILKTGYKLVKPYLRNGYLCVHLCKNNKAKHFEIHRLVAENFIKNLENKPQVNHKNGNKNDNRVENLEWVSCFENIKHKYDILGYKVSDETKSKMRESAFIGWQKRRLKCL